MKHPISEVTKKAVVENLKVWLSNIAYDAHYVKEMDIATTREKCRELYAEHEAAVEQLINVEFLDIIDEAFDRAGIRVQPTNCDSGVMYFSAWSTEFQDCMDTWYDVEKVEEGVYRTTSPAPDYPNIKVS